MHRQLGWILSLVLLLASLPSVVRAEDAPPGLSGGSLAYSSASFSGETLNDQAGRAVAGVGDVNGDGFQDFVIGAPGHSSGQGRVYLYLGGPSGWSINHGLFGADAIYTGEVSGSGAGRSLAGAGDVNGDGFDDIIIGAPNVSRVYLLLGSAAPTSANLSAADGIYSGVSGERAGTSVAGAGDINGDGFADVLVGADEHNSGTGRVYLVLGTDTLSNLDLIDNAEAIYTGEAAGDYAGTSVASVGDVNGDYYADILIGAKAYDSNRGRAYLILGSAEPTSANLAAADGIYTGESSGDNAGKSLAGAGDVNGDGFADFVIGAFGNDAGGSSAGRVYLILGAPMLSSVSLDAADAIYIGDGVSGRAGQCVAGAGDVNGDGYSDLLVGADGVDNSAGSVYLVLGSAMPGDRALDDADVAYTGENGFDYAGRAVAGPGDVNGDGLADLLVGADAYAASTSNIGKAYLILSDYEVGVDARYQLFNIDLAALPSDDVRESLDNAGVIVHYATVPSEGAFIVTRHSRGTCRRDTVTNGLLWTVDSRWGPAGVDLTFIYNDSQIAGMVEGDLKLYYRDRPCAEWVLDGDATLDTTHNRLTSSPLSDPHREYTIAAEAPSPTSLGFTALEAVVPQMPWWQIGIFIVLAGLTIADVRRAGRAAHGSS